MPIPVGFAWYLCKVTALRRAARGGLGVCSAPVPRFLLPSALQLLAHLLPNTRSPPGTG